ncbi:TRCF domain-containing protein [Gemmatimonas sp.]|uniref:TRCF domain-containing protein n=1 Tax=Gemmatimonas sp. TaxID=1962908 RepID=UPI003DA49421
MPADVTLDFPSYLPDEYIASQEAKLDVYRRLTALRDPQAIEALKGEVRDRFGALPAPADALFGSAMLRVIGASLGVEGVLVRASEARVTFRADAVPRLKGLSAAFHGVQFQVDVRRAQPLALKLTRLGGAEMLEGLIRALKALVP